MGSLARFPTGRHPIRVLGVGPFFPPMAEQPFEALALLNRVLDPPPDANPSGTVLISDVIVLMQHAWATGYDKGVADSVRESRLICAEQLARGEDAGCPGAILKLLEKNNA